MKNNERYIVLNVLEIGKWNVDFFLLIDFLNSRKLIVVDMIIIFVWVNIVCYKSEIINVNKVIVFCLILGVSFWVIFVIVCVIIVIVMIFKLWI